MGKKRKASGQAEAPKPFNDDEKIKLRVQTFEDVADSDDEFHLNRDRVLLDEAPATKRQRKWREQEEFLEPSDEEVLAYSDEEEDSDEAAIDTDVEADGGDGAVQAQSDSERSPGPDEEDDEAWGTTKKDYYNADAIETEQDALDEEAEALRLQRKQLQSMTDADYGFDEADWQENGKLDGADEDAESKGHAVVTERLPQLQVTEDMGPAERLKLLKSRYPEFEPLGKEFLHMQEEHERLQSKALAFMKLAEPDANGAKNKTASQLTKYRACAAYLASLTMYFVLLTSTADDVATNGVAMSATQLRSHPIMDSLNQCHELWLRVKDRPDDELPEKKNQAPVQDVADTLIADRTNDDASHGAASK
ncbi:something about silencing protein 10, partial [Elasticomyces elasticus]